MNGITVERPPWSRRRWWGVIVGVFGMQIALLYWFGARGPVKARPASPAPVLQYAGETAATWLTPLLDPTLFAQGHLHGFSGASWMPVFVPVDHPPEWTEPPRWLAFDAQQLGADFRRFIQTNRPFTVAFTAKAEPQVVWPAIETVIPVTGSPSTLRVEGALASRRLLTSPQLQPWAHSELLTNTVLRILVDDDGNVLSRVLLGSSGYKAADDSALDWARAARFEPRPPGGGRQTLAMVSTFGTLVFEWQTLPATNTPSATPKP